MHHAHNRRRVAKAVEHLTPRLSGLPGVIIHPHAKLGIFSLYRRVYHVAGDERVLSGLADQHGVMVDRVAGCRNKLDRLVEHKIALHDLRAFGLDDRQDGRRIVLTGMASFVRVVNTISPASPSRSTLSE
jgi:hypothetical protein